MNPTILNISPKHPVEWISHYSKLNELIPKINQAERPDQLPPDVLQQAVELSGVDPMFYIYFTAHFNLERTYTVAVEPDSKDTVNEVEYLTRVEFIDNIFNSNEEHKVSELHFITQGSETRYTMQVQESTTVGDVHDFISGIKEEIEIIEEVFKDHPRKSYHSYHKVPDKELYECIIHFKNGQIL